MVRSEKVRTDVGRVMAARCHARRESQMLPSHALMYFVVDLSDDYV